MPETHFHRELTACNRRCGQALVEFAMALLVILMLIFGVIEFGRIVLVYNSIANGARIGARYAITNSSPPNATSVTNADLSTIQSNVQTVVKSFLAPTTVNINAAGLSITTAFPNKSCTGSIPTSTCSGTSAGNLVQVTVSYPYDLLIPYYPININLSSTSEGIITW